MKRGIGGETEGHPNVGRAKSLPDRDMSKSIEAEDELQRARQLESIAALSGGIAHDYNNLLTVIIGNVSLIQSYVDPQDMVYRLLNEVNEAALVATRRDSESVAMADFTTAIERIVAGPGISAIYRFLVETGRGKESARVRRRIAEVGEDCDASDLAGASCVSLGLDGGTLSCSGGCTFGFAGSGIWQGEATAGLIVAF